MPDRANPFVFLENMPPSQVAEILSTELAFVQGAALCMMPPAASAKIMASMDDNVRRDVAAAMSKSRQMPRDVLVDIADELRKKCPAPAPKPQKTLGESISDLQGLIKGHKSKTNINGPEIVPARIIPPGQKPQGFSQPAPQAGNPSEATRNAARDALGAMSQEASSGYAQTENVDANTDNALRESAMQAMLEQAKRKKVVASPPAGQRAPGGAKPGRGAHKIDGMALAAHILREADVSVRNNVMHELPELYDKLHEQMFDFADLEHSDKITLGKIFTNIDLKVAAMALRFASEELQQKVYHSISKNRAQLIIEEIESAANEQVRLSAIDEAQQAVIDFAVTLQDKGQIVIDPNAPDLI